MSTVKRSYRSPKRDEAARATRLAVIGAAHELFVEQGYGATSIDAIAARAGVGRATVFNAVGGKPALMRAAHHAAIVGGDDPREPSDVFGIRLAGVTGAGDVLQVYADVLAEVFEALGPIHEALVKATSESDELREMLAQHDDDRYRGARAIVDMVVAELAHGITVERATDILWLYNDPGLWQSLHHSRGWSRTDFCAWLTRTLRSQLLDN